MTNSSPERNLSRLGASRLVVRAGAILCQRRGAITPQDQGQGPFSGRAPEGRGVWAFPFPYNDDFFNWHKWDEILPKHLTTEAIKAVFLAEEHLSDEQSTTTALWAARDAWIKKHGGLLPVAVSGGKATCGRASIDGAPRCLALEVKVWVGSC